MPRYLHSALIAVLFLMGAAAPTRMSDMDQLRERKVSYASPGQPVTLVLPRPSDPRMDFRPQINPSEPDRSAYFVRARDATRVVQPILFRELANAGYQPRLGAMREDAGAELGVYYEVTRAWTTQLMPGMWPAPGLYRATVSAHVEIFRGSLDCMAQSYFIKGEGANAWAAFNRALDRLLAQSIPELIDALSRCGAPASGTE